MAVQYSMGHSMSNYPGHDTLISKNFFKFIPVVGIVAMQKP